MEIPISMNVLHSTLWHQKLQISKYRSLHSSFHKFVYYQSLRNVFLVGDFIAQTRSHLGQDLHLDDNGINLLEVSRPHWLREFDDIGQYNVFGRFLIINLSFCCSVIFDGVYKFHYYRICLELDFADSWLIQSSRPMCIRTWNVSSVIAALILI